MNDQFFNDTKSIIKKVSSMKLLNELESYVSKYLMHTTTPDTYNLEWEVLAKEAFEPRRLIMEAAVKRRGQLKLQHDQ